MRVEFRYGDREFAVEGDFTPATADTHEVQGDPAEFDVESCVCDGEDLSGDALDALVDDDGWYGALLDAAAEVAWDDTFDMPDDSMDGDHESALASCGWGTDEDYGCYDGGDGDY